jgi:putative ABC transport system ATP-binding protein
MMSQPLVAPPAVPVALREVSKQYRRGQVRALDGVSVEFARHTFTAVMGPSGSGKSTLLHCAAGLERPTSGSVWLAGQELARLSEKRLTKLRRSSVGFVFQAFNLVPALTVRENVLLPLRLARARWDKQWPEEIIRRVGLADRARHRPAELSGGQEQRVAIARALVARPEVIFCDEPTGALDSGTAADVLGLLREAVDTGHQTVVMVTHDPVAASYADRVVFLTDGMIVEDVEAPGAAAIAGRLARLGGRVSRGARA